MLDLKHDYIDFGEQLQPPPSYEIDYGIATTYTMDLHALLTIPLAIFYRQNLESTIGEDNFQILESIQNLPQHFRIYCHKGKISVPDKTAIKLLSFIEDCVVEVKPDSKSQVFHPKVWVVRFKPEKEGRVRYRVLVMSRNLTFDQSYDIAYCMEGVVGRSINTMNTDLVKLVKWLDKKNPIPHDRFIRELARVQFEDDDAFHDRSFSFLPKPNAQAALEIEKKFDRRLVISPFLSDKITKQLKSVSKEPLLIFSRKVELDKLKPVSLEGTEPYFFSERIIDGSQYEALEEGQTDMDANRLWDNNLHAKIFIRENKDDVKWNIGSANCTNAAFQRNIEFMINLDSGYLESGIQEIKNNLLDEHNGVKVFERYLRHESAIDTVKEVDFRSIEYEILQLLANPKTFYARVVPGDMDENYHLHIHLILKDVDLSKYRIEIGPLGQNEFKILMPGENDVVFTNISLNKLSRFLVWQIKDRLSKESSSMIVKIEIDRLPEKRLSSIFKSIIESPEKLMILIRGLLKNEPIENASIALEQLQGNNGHGINWRTNSIKIPIYEDLMISLSRTPSKVSRLKTIIDKLEQLEDEEELLSEEFVKFWNTIKHFISDD